MREYSERFPIPGPDSERAMTAMRAWKYGDGPIHSADNMPKVLLAPKPRKFWPDAFTAKNGLYVVSERAKKIIELLDPEVHQFFPLLLQTKRGIEIDGPWFAMIVYAKQDSILVEKSRVSINVNFPDTNCSFYGDSNPEDVIVDPKRQSNLNLWREQKFMGSLLGSGTLVEHLKGEGVKFFPSFRATDIKDHKTQGD